MIYKASCVVVEGTHPGAIVNLEAPPEVGDEIQLDDESFRVTEVVDLLPPREGFVYLHVTCQPIEEQS